MEQKLRARAAVFVGAFLWVGIESGLAAPPQVPKLPAEIIDYFKYAVTDLPAHFKDDPNVEPDAADLDNTPAIDQLPANPSAAQIEAYNARATLGRVLFYDKRLSHGDGVACASCHKQTTGFSDDSQFSTGVNGQTGRHSPGLSNSRFYTAGHFWDERAATLEDQALLPIQSPVEMGMTLPALVTKLSATEFYPTLFNMAFGSPDVTPEKIGRAIAQFERTMVSYKSKYDAAFTNGVPNFPGTLTADEDAGRQLFHDNGLRCSQCHRTNAHVGDEARNIGLDLVTDGSDGSGDVGKVEVIGGNSIDGQFKTPSLRNVGARIHFMHDGRFTSLAEVIEFYNSGVLANPDLDTRLKVGGSPLRLNLTSTQKNQLLAYLLTLTDNEFLTDVRFSDPFIDLPGDYDGSGEVDAADYEVWRQHYGDTMLLVADGNNDLKVDAADYTVWRNNFGASWMDFAFGGGAIAGTVPEPGALLLMLVALGWFGCMRRRRS